jgi:hypothetical protein
MALFAGVSYNYKAVYNEPQLKENAEATDDDPSEKYEFEWSKRSDRHWPGFFGGLRWQVF